MTTTGRVSPQNPLIFHSNRCSQNNAEILRRQLGILNIEQSISGVGNCHDNALMESFWGRMKTELRSEMIFEDLRHARRVVYHWVHLFYYGKPLHSGIGHLTTVEFEEQLFSQATDRIHCQCNREKITFAISANYLVALVGNTGITRYQVD